jgi:hypothetical protein
MQPSTIDEYALIQQNNVLFQENCQHNQNEQKLYMEWQYAVNGWQNAENAWKIANSEIGQLKSVVNNLQKHIDELKANMMKMGVTEPNGPAIPIPSSIKEPEYQTDEEELAKETEWIRVKHRTKKRKMNVTPSPPTLVDPRNKNTPQIEHKIKKEPAPPPIMVDNINSYENLYGELTNQILKENVQVKFTNDTTAKINCNNSENYRKAINVLQNNNFNFHTYENKQSRSI